MWIGGVRVAVVDDDNRVLMLRQHHEGRDIWMLPGGAIEEGENAEQAAVREVKEETGLDIRIKALLWHIEEVSKHRGQRFVNFFLADIIGGCLKLGTDPERGVRQQVLREARFMQRQEIEGLEALYPDYLRDELWPLLKEGAREYNPFKIRVDFGNL